MEIQKSSFREGKNVESNRKVFRHCLDGDVPYGRNKHRCSPNFGRRHNRRRICSSQPCRPGSQRQELGVRPVFQLRQWRRRPLVVQVSFGRLSVGQATYAGSSCRHFHRPVRVWRQHHAAMAGLHSGSAYGDLHLYCVGGACQLRSAGCRRHIYGRQPHPCHLPLELPYQIAADSALVPGRGRAHLHDTPVSAELFECAGVFRRRQYQCVELFTAGRRGLPLLHPRQAIDRRGSERRAYLLGLAGDRNPGVNASIQVQVGYTFWK